MATSFKQQSRIGKLTTPLGEDALVLARFDATEGVSELFEIRIEAYREAEKPHEKLLEFDSAIGEHVTLTLKTLDDSERHFDGILTETRWLGHANGAHTYRLVLRPWLWVLSRRINSLIFHEMTAPDIIKQIFAKHGDLANFDQSGLSKSYPKLEYCVQYRESDMAFVCRLMEKYGISYRFEHKDGAHRLIMFDTVSSTGQVSGGSRPFHAVSGNNPITVEHVHQWIPERRLTTGKVTYNDYDFKKPSANIRADHTGDAVYSHGKLEEYEYPGQYVATGEGQLLANARLDMHRARDKHFLAAGDFLTCAPGLRFNLEKHPDQAQNNEYFALRCVHSFIGQAYRSGQGDGSNEAYRGTYEFITADRQFAPPMTTARPLIHGPQTAKVVGPSGEEIYCDKYGRVRVQFHWDREDDQSMWCRVAQVWAGKKWGGMFIPRVGMEVVVEFLEGDPDRPIIVGCVYNEQNMPPYALPDNQTMNGWKTNSSKGGGGYNELVFEDKAGSELFRVHAQKDMDTTVLNDEQRLVKHDRTTKIENDESVEIIGQRKTTIKKTDTLEVTSDILIKSNTKITLQVGKSSIVMDGMSITIKTGALSTSATLSSMHSSDGMLDIKGKLVTINS